MKMWIHLVYFMIYMMLPSCLISQNGQSIYGDEWITEGQAYYKLSVSEVGIYRISKSVLEQAGIPVASIASEDYRLISLGKEIPLRTSSSGIMGDADFIEFYGLPNDGSIDAMLYRDPSNQQLNPYISLYSEKRPYYLTWTDGGNAQRYIEQTNGLESNGRPPREPYYMHREIITYDDFHHKPSHDGRNFIRYSSMDDGEGFGSSLERERTISLKVDKLSSFGIDPRIVIRFGTNVLSRNWRVSTDLRELKVATQRGYGVIDVDERFPFEELAEGDQNIHIKPLSSENEKHTAARIELHYPRLYEFDGETQISFFQQASIITRYIEINGFGGTDPILYNLTNQSYLFPELVGDKIRFITPGATEEHQWILVDQESAVKQISSVTKTNFDITEDVGDYMIISHDELIESGVVDKYAQYRSSPEGGGYHTSIVSINDLIERYAYGINGHPIGIKNMMRNLRDKGNLPDFIFIIGKGREYTDIKEGLRTRALVPTFGIPGSDNLFVAFDGQRHPHRPIGRLAAQHPWEVEDYLDKIKAHEIRDAETQTKEDQLWKKKVIHLSGGSASNQSILFRFLNDMGDVISNNAFGANVFTFRKTSADPLQRVTTEDIVSRVDEGAALLTFFGHSAVGTFDFSLEDPGKYNNQGRNPIILSLGCHSGNIHTSVGGISEDFVLEKEKGAIAFIASSGTAYPEPQYFTGINFYDLIGGEMYGQPIGKILQRSLEERTKDPSVAVQTLIEQLTLHGDPAFRYGSFEGPDYSIDQESVRVEPGILDATTPKFTFTFNVLNLGAMEEKVLDIRIIHLLPDGSAVDTLVVSIPAPAHSSEVSIDLNNPGAEWVGSNRILVTVDPESDISERPSDDAELNNDLIGQDGQKGTSFFVFDNSAKPVLPPDFGILNTPSITLRSAVNNGLDPGGKFIMQIDTTETFDSPAIVEEIRENTTSIIDWCPGITKIEGAVYYWRIAPIDANNRLKSDTWQSASFIYLPDSPNGWNQSHFYQWQKDSYYKMSLDEKSRTFQYDERVWDIRIKNAIRDEGDFWVYVNNTPWASLNPRGKGTLLSIFAWDRQQVIFKNNGSDYGSIPFTSDGFIYKMDKPEDVENVSFLLAAIPEGARVFFHTMLDDDVTGLNIEQWNQPLSSGLSLIEQLEALGASRIRELNDKGTVPYTFIFDKGVGPVVEDIANNIYETVDLTSKAKTLWSDGTITSIPLQAQDRWLRLMWEETKRNEDQTRLLVLGIRAVGAIDTLKIIENDYDVNLTSIDPARYPRLQLVYQTADTESKTAPQLSYWRVITSALPDAAFYANQSSFEIVDTINAGEELIIDFDLVNLTDVGMEPMLIKYTLIDDNFKENVFVRRSSKLSARDTINVVEDVPTDLLAGDYRLVIEINPTEEQKEVTNCNNLGYTNFYVRPDKRNPYLDVTFDGRHIANMEQISPTPEIVISLRDEDSFLLLDDPRDFKIRLTSPLGEIWKVNLDSSAVEWIPSPSLENNTASFVLRPNLPEGIHILEVEAKDKAGNKSGDQTYRIAFEVALDHNYPKLTVSPNPMTTFTEFVYYLDTDFIPEIFDLYIYSTDGKLIKHATKSDFGGLKQGLNIYRWNGLSDYGNELGGGLYFYEIVNSFDSRKEKRKGSVLKLNY